MPKCAMAAKTALQVDSISGMSTDEFNTCPRQPEVFIRKFRVVMEQWVQRYAPNFAANQENQQKNLM